MARKLCHGESYLKNFNLCAGENIVGPISDIEQISKNAADKIEQSDLDEEDDDEDFEWDD